MSEYSIQPQTSSCQNNAIKTKVEKNSAPLWLQLSLVSLWDRILVKLTIWKKVFAVSGRVRFNTTDQYYKCALHLKMQKLI